MPAVVLVDESDRAVGFEEKIEAHRNGGSLHRAFSVFIFNRRGEMLLQRRAASKYHFPGTWANACCSHPMPGEAVAAAARRRLREELGFDTELRKAFSFIYTARDAASDLTEREFDHVFVGRFDGQVCPLPEEVDAVRWVDCGELLRDAAGAGAAYAPWLRLLLPRLGELRGALAQMEAEAPASADAR